VIPLEPVLPNGLTASQVRIAASMVQSGTPVGDVAAHIEQWKQANIQGRQQAATQAALEAQQNYDRQEAYRKAQVAAEQTQYERGRQSQADQRAADEAARQAAEEERKRAAAADPLQGKNDDERMERTLLTIGPKVRAGMPLTPAEEDQYDLMRTRYAEGPVQQVPDGKGGTVLAHVPREIPARFPPLPGKTDAAGPKPIPGTEKQPDFAPQPIIGGLLANATGQTKIAKALASLQAYPGAVGPIALQPDFLSQRTDPEGVRLRADIGDVQGHIFHDLAGSAQSAQESARLRPFVPTPTDSAEAIKTKLTRMLEVNRETMLQGYRAYGPEVGGRRIPVIEEAILGSIPEAALNDLKADPKLAGAFDRKYGKGTAKLVLQ
jgi:hypothetical protein